MTSDVYKKFIELAKYREDKELLFLSIIFNVAPIIEGHKPASIISFSRNDKGLYYAWDNYKYELKDYCNLRYFELKRTDGYILVMFYDSHKLSEALNEEKNIRFLKRFGYKNWSRIDKFLSLLKRRFEVACPHEVGIFLGYPIEDVVGFMNNCGENCILCGYWKVYHNPDKAIELFRKYNKSKEHILELIIRGTEPSALIKQVA
ncbi:hypothetical protein CLTEP_13060 [Clostridium tepidiprofundi DSM 19306]|uniref:DUF3793 domain-containing protein n=1 Tax=Clostridium tepidiprofundi DSM 19306 TaxID=1121338 RepID=A0A151B471_9CLOT|nr:DUF3793 family protein [Clostridium tepidiprofundi]KYH34709.1 hypothetical protein CLTEP_13060 [Clostridium tepidiprofundi DSM 19306]